MLESVRVVGDVVDVVVVGKGEGRERGRPGAGGEREEEEELDTGFLSSSFPLSCHRTKYPDTVRTRTVRSGVLGQWRVSTIHMYIPTGYRIRACESTSVFRTRHDVESTRNLEKKKTKCSVERKSVGFHAPELQQSRGDE